MMASHSPFPLIERTVRLGIVRVDQVENSLHTLCELIYNTLKAVGITSECCLLDDGVSLGRQPSIASDIRQVL